MSYEEEHGIGKLKSIYLDKYQTTINTPLKKATYVAYSADIEVGKEFRDNYYGMSKMDESKEQVAHNSVANQTIRGFYASTQEIIHSSSLAVEHGLAKSAAWGVKKAEQFQSDNPDEYASAQVKYNNMVVALRDVAMDNSKEFYERMERSSLSKTEKDGIAFDFGSGIGSLATSIGVGIVGKSAKAAGAIFGLSAGRHGYEEALNKGFDPDKAFDFGVKSGIVEGSLEFIGLKYLDKMSKSPKLLQRVFGGSSSEFAQEFAQEGTGSVLANRYGIRDESTKEILHGAFAAGVMGAVLGGGASAILGATRGHLEDTSLDKKEVEALAEKISKDIIKSDVLEEYIDMIKNEKSPLTSKDNNPEAQIKEIEKAYKKATSFDEEFFDIQSKSENYALSKGFSKKESKFIGVIEQARAVNMYNNARILPSDFMEKYRVSFENKRDQLKLRQNVAENKDKLAVNSDLSLPINIVNNSKNKEEAFKKFKEAKMSFKEKNSFSKLYSDGGMLNLEQSFDNFYKDMQEKPEIFEDPNTYNQSKKYETTESPAYVKTENGYVKFDGSKATITMLKKGDFSTLVHEMGHVFLNDQQILGGDLYKKTLKWLGSTDGKLTREMHEKFADTFVVYLKEGKAPTASLKKVFIQFKEWLSGMYKGAKKSGITVHPTIQDIFDEIIAPSTEEIKTITQMAKKAIKEKTLLDRSSLKKEGLETLNKVSGGLDADSIQRKLAVKAELNAGTFASSLRLVFGKKLSSRLNMAYELITMNNEVAERTRELNSIFDEAYGVNNESSRNILTAQMIKKNKEYTLSYKEKHLKYSKMELISIYMQRKNSRQKDAYNFFFDKSGKNEENTIDVLLENLSYEDKAYGDNLLEFYKRYYPKMNKLFLEVKGEGLGNPENYSPVKTEINKEFDLFENYNISAKTPSAIKSREEVAGMPEPTNAIIAASNYVAQAEHWLNVGKQITATEKLVRDLKYPIINAYGEKIYKKLLKNIETASINGFKRQQSENERVFNKFLNNWIIAKVALNPTVTVKQLISTVNYASEVNIVDFSRFFIEGTLSPKKTMEYMFKNAPRLRTRLERGGEDVLNRALEKTNNTGYVESFLASHGIDTISIKKLLTSNVRYGDIAPQVYGGYAFVQSKMKEGMSKADAFREFDIRSEETQQTSLSVFKTDIQNDTDAYKRLFTAFKSGIMSSMSKMISSQVMYNRGEISAKQHLKTMTIFGAVVPAMYGAAGHLVGQLLSGFRDGEDEEGDVTKDMIKNIVMTPFNAFALVSIAANMVEQAVEYGHAFPTNIPIFSEIQKGINDMIKKDSDPTKLLFAIIEPLTSSPLTSLKKTAEKILDAEPEKKKKKRKMKLI